MASLVAQRLKPLPAIGRPRFDPESGRTPGERNGNPLQYSRLENPWTEKADRLQSTGSQSRTRLSDFTFTLVDRAAGTRPHCVARGQEASALRAGPCGLPSASPAGCPPEHSLLSAATGAGFCLHV